ncbi:hypothetical protein GGS21DRAFT_405394 [Xylaria nigripes]|nr:hypothetical protein GGS21DRAFT_405394 [Xylaria nigripes]
MENNYEGKGFHYQDEVYFPKHQGSPDWLVSPSSSTPMTRGSSGESTSTAYSNDTIRKPSSEYGTYGSMWPSVSASHQDSLWSPVPDSSSYDINVSPNTSNLPYLPGSSECVTASSGSYGNMASESDKWWEYYNFIADVEPGQKPYWRLKPQFTPTSQYPPMRANEEYITVSQPQTKDGMFVCLAEGCSKSFKRKADLERHYKNLHTLSEWKDQFPCDWKRCQRAKEPFHRIDHQREHYREFHHEDIMRRGSPGKQDREWWSSRVINHDWWRCSRCLCRVSVEEYGYQCRECKTDCERERIAHRTSHAC